MNISTLSPETRVGLRAWSNYHFGDALALDGINSFAPAWAWVMFLLREAEDRPEWFPRGKWAVIQRIEQELTKEAQEETLQILSEAWIARVSPPN